MQRQVPRILRPGLLGLVFSLGMAACSPYSGFHDGTTPPPGPTERSPKLDATEMEIMAVRDCAALERRMDQCKGKV